MLSTNPRVLVMPLTREVSGFRRRQQSQGKPLEPQCYYPRVCPRFCVPRRKSCAASGNSYCMLINPQPPWMNVWMNQFKYLRNVTSLNVCVCEWVKEGICLPGNLETQYLRDVARRARYLHCSVQYVVFVRAFNQQRAFACTRPHDARYSSCCSDSTTPHVNADLIALFLQ
jgi:hypothetical protein